MNHWSKTGLFLAGAVVALAGGLVGCNKAPSKEGAASSATAAAATPASASDTVAASLQEPALEIPKGNSPEVAAVQQRYVQWIIDKAMPAGEKKPSFPDPNRTDSVALLQRYKYLLWGIAETKVAGAAGAKQAGEFLGADKATAPQSPAGQK